MRLKAGGGDARLGLRNSQVHLQILLGSPRRPPIMIPLCHHGVDRVLAQERGIVSLSDRVHHPWLSLPEFFQIPSVRAKETSPKVPADDVLPIILLAIYADKLNGHHLFLFVAILHALLLLLPGLHLAIPTSLVHSHAHLNQVLDRKSTPGESVCDLEFLSVQGPRSKIYQ